MSVQPSQKALPPLFTTPVKVGIVATAVAIAALLSVAIYLQLSPYVSMCAIGMGASEVLFIALYTILKDPTVAAAPPPPAVTAPPRPFVPVHMPCLVDRSKLSPIIPVAAENAKEQPALPMLGTYHTGYQDLTPGQFEVVWRLPNMTGFPQPLQDFIGATPNPDLFFLVIRDTTGTMLPRNLVMHRLVLPEYQNGWMRTNMQLRMFEPKGVTSSLSKDEVHVMPAILHDGTSVSPNNCHIDFQDDQKLSSFWMGVKYRERACAFYTLVIRESESPHDAMLAARTRRELLDLIPDAHRPAFAADAPWVTAAG